MVAAAALSVDKLTAASAALDHAAVYPKDLVALMGAQGMFGMAPPERWGGTDLGFATYVKVVRTLSEIGP